MKDVSRMEIRELARQTDTELARLHNARGALQERRANTVHGLKSYAGAKWYYRGRQRVTDMTYAEAREIVETELAELKAYDEANADDGTRWAKYEAKNLQGRDMRSATALLQRLDDCIAEIDKLGEQMEEFEQTYFENGCWSRFFLVTSSTGHIHSSMGCSTCRPTTTFGWLPSLSGATEKEAVEAHGPNLCSVCFKSAPVEWQGGKITKAAAVKAAA